MKTSNNSLKLALIGPQRVGKTSLLTRFHLGTFELTTTATVGASFIVHTFVIDGKEVSFQIWDTAGQERYRSLGPIYYRDSACAICVFDLTSPQSFEDMKAYISQFQTHCSDYIHIGIVGNKFDLYQKSGGIDLDIVQNYVKSEGFTFYKTSACTGENVKSMFQDIATIIIRHNSESRSPQSLLNINGNNDQSQGICC
ncbi:small GTP-binding protein [Tritrichomonas foetus]|uniref:Small GTP-binding protein n=1 Tax=Tritrichomonas foetus TaxID=1144522 RepID=A0A1J4JWS8_9EUKA|nr:small GTP-binding protein [Tritrichomonas foetus]|eukprot:OHT01990.1 small GTP-binding protein [Tritrichomonas foetus]